MVRQWFVRSALAALLTCSSITAMEREVAVTFDDLPAAPSFAPKLLNAIRDARVPAIGFVNESKLQSKAAVAVLAQWADAGLELGNHTYAHRDLHRIPVAEFEEEIVRGEKVTRALLHERKRAPRWFRHPFLHTGTSLETKQRVESFLAKRGYRVAPVTLDNSEWIFAKAYTEAKDAATRKRVGEAYVVYMDAKLAYFEDQSQKLFGRNIRHVLLVHANALNADWFDELAASMRARGYRFIPLERAVEDEAYRSADTYTGPAGLTWIHRWALTAGKRGTFFAGEPTTPQWIQDLAGIEE
jgi:peptidoglycan/xylan/chitin deacetylase (PgdA/CDA1 family)